MGLEILKEENKTDYRKLKPSDLIECSGDLYLVSEHPNDILKNIYIQIRTGEYVHVHSAIDDNIRKNQFKIIEKGTTLIYK